MKKAVSIVLFLILIGSVSAISFTAYQGVYYAQRSPELRNLEQGQVLVREATDLRLRALYVLPVLDDVRVRKIDRTRVLRAKLGIREGLDAHYYVDHAGLNCAGREVFKNDRVAMQNLLQLSCYIPIQLQEGRFISPGGIRVRTTTGSGTTVRFTDIGRVTCNNALRQMTDQAFKLLLDVEEKLAQAAIVTSPCARPEAFATLLGLVEENRVRRQYLKAVDNLESVWRRAVSCKC